ncbi:MAG: integrase [Massilia sp.]|nr:integrase [Massilia sp.]
MRRNAKHRWQLCVAGGWALSVTDVDTDLVVKVLRPIWGTKTETAVRLRGRIGSILDWATVSKYRHGEIRPGGGGTFKPAG